MWKGSEGGKLLCYYFFAFPLFVPNSIGPEIHHFLLHSRTHIYGSVITRLKDL